MPHNRLIIIAFLLFALVLSVPIYAQEGNLLRDPGFENTSVWKTVVFDEASGTRFSVAPDWSGWYTESPRTQDWQNRVPNGYPHSETGAGFTHSGNRSQEISRGAATFTAAVYQTVAVPEGSNVVGSAWVRMNLDLNTNPAAQARVGIDPNGGNSPFDSDVVWSSWAVDAVNGFQQLTANATATGSSVTLFLYATQSFPSDPNGVYWDDASLTVGGPGGAAAGDGAGAEPANTAAPPAPAVAAFVEPQGAQEDGSIVHTVQSGDTLDAIAVAYDTTRQELIDLNDITNPRLLRVGQELLIRPASGDSGSSGDGGGETTAQSDGGEAETTEGAEATEDAEPPATPTPAPTSTPAPPAPVAMADTEAETDADPLNASVCVMLFEDQNMNRIQEQGESALEGGTISLMQNGEDIDSFATDGTPDPFCFSELEPGEYLAVASPPGGYGLTTPDQLRLRLQPGVALNVTFGAAQGVEALPPPTADSADLEQETVADTESQSDDNDLLRNLGLIVFGLAGVTLVGGLGAAILLRRR